jgi:hypothetical protein
MNSLTLAGPDDLVGSRLGAVTCITAGDLSARPKLNGGRLESFCRPGLHVIHIFNSEKYFVTEDWTE